VLWKFKSAWYPLYKYATHNLHSSVFLLIESLEQNLKEGNIFFIDWKFGTELPSDSYPVMKATIACGEERKEKHDERTK
jgi:hypothetical protein